MSRTSPHRLAISAATSLFAALALAVAPSAHGQGSTDPRVGLKSGLQNAQEVSKNIRLVSHKAKADSLSSSNLGGLTYANSDLAFRGNYVFQGNFSGFQIWDITKPADPVLKTVFMCSSAQGDPSIYGNLLFISGEGATRNDCRVSTGRGGGRGAGRAGGGGAAAAPAGPPPPPDTTIFRGVRVFDVSNILKPKQVALLQNCRGSHTHTLVPDPKDKSIVYVYFQGSSGLRNDPAVPGGCSGGQVDTNPKTAQYKIDIYKVPVLNPKAAKLTDGGRIFNNLVRGGTHGNAPPPVAVAGDTGGRGAGGRGAGGGGGGRQGGGGAPQLQDQCHDLTAYPAMGLAAGACQRFGLLLDIKDPANPRRIDFAADTNFALWHSATFSNDASKLLFSDEWGGGTAPRCRAIDPINWGGDAIFDLSNGNMVMRSYFKMPAPQSDQENCVAHNGGLVPIPGRDIMVQGWYQGGIDVFDFSDTKHPVEIAYFDRGPLRADSLFTGGYWGGYYYNGYIIGSEIARGIDIFELTPSEYLSKNELDAAKSVKLDQLNPQSQPHIVWPATFSLPRAYLDQLERNKGLDADKIAATRKDLDAAEKLAGPARQAALTKSATTLEPSAAKATDGAKVKLVVSAIKALAAKP